MNDSSFSRFCFLGNKSRHSQAASGNKFLPRVSIISSITQMTCADVGVCACVCVGVCARVRVCVGVRVCLEERRG